MDMNEMYVLMGLAALAVGMGTIYILCLCVAMYEKWRLVSRLPTHEWVTLEDMVDRGMLAFWCEGLLPLLYQDGFLEVRARDGLSSENLIAVNDQGFISRTVRYHEFRKRSKSRGRRKVRVKSAPRLLWAPA